MQISNKLYFSINQYENIIGIKDMHLMFLLYYIFHKIIKKMNNKENKFTMVEFGVYKLYII